MKEIPTIVEPIFKPINIKARTVVFCDEGEDDWNRYFKREFDDMHISFDNLIIFDNPSAFKEDFSIFMFDWVECQ